jgi:UPF0716 protein FxsA
MLIREFIPIRPAACVRYFLWALPFIEMTGFVIVGRMVGVFITLLLMIATTMLGLALLRNYYSILLALHSSWQGQAVMPEQQMLHSMGYLFAAALLLIPGFFTDIIGLLLLNFQVRAYVMKRLLIKKSQFGPAEQRKPSERAEEGDIIEGEFWSKYDHDKRNQ